MIFGAVLMVGGALLVSKTIAEKEKRKIEILEALCRLITYIKQNIETFGTPIDDIIAGYRCEILEGYGFKDAIRLRGEREIPYQLIELISEEAQSDLKAFVKNVGGGYKDEETGRCDYYLSRFETHLQLEKEKFNRNAPLYRYLPLFGALSAVIMLI